MLKVVYKGRLKGYRLDFMGKRKLLEANPDRYESYLDGGTETNRLRTDYTRRLRLHSLAEVCTIMHNAGVEIFQDSKPKVYQPNTRRLLDTPNALSNDVILQSAVAPKGQYTALPNPIHTITAPCFYTSREQKGQDDNAIRGSRAVGTLLTPTHVYAVYNTGSTESQWRDGVERRFMVEVQEYICRRVLVHQYDNKAVSGIMIGENLGTLVRYLQPETKQKSGLHFLTATYQPFYFITNDNHGETQLKLLCDDAKMKLLRTTLSTGGLPPDLAYPIEHDALTEDGNPVLFCCLPDIPRLVRFRTGMYLHDKTGTVICFDFQLEMLRHYLGDSAVYVSLDFEKFVGRFFVNNQLPTH